MNVEINEPTPVLRNISKSLLVEEPPKTDAKPKVKKPTKLAPKPKVGLSAWVIQVGSFSKRDNAIKLVSRLRKAKFDTMEPEQVDLRGRILYRVRVGPIIKKAKAEKYMPGIEKVSGLKGQIVRYP